MVAPSTEATTSRAARSSWRFTSSAMSLRVALEDQLRDPDPQPGKMLLVVVGGGLSDPPGGFVVLDAQRVPLLEHPSPAGVGLDPRHVPWHVAHRRQKLRVERIDVDVVAFV